MKLTHSAILLFAIFFLFGMTTKPKVVGYWEIYKIERLGKPKAKNQRGKFIEFHPDGKMTGGRIGEEPNKSGEWKLNKKARTITFITPERPQDGGDYSIIELSKKSLILQKDSTKAYLDRGMKEM